MVLSMQSDFVLHISGPTCAGKSTLVSRLAHEYTFSYVVSYDAVKKQFPHYDRNLHKDASNAITYALYEDICQQQIPQIFFEFWLKDAAAFTKAKQTALDNGYRFISMHLHAPKEILLQRFKERVADAQKAGVWLSLTDEDIFMRHISQDFFVSEESIQLDSSLLTIDQLVSKIQAKISS